jgi:hypothetical protein
MVAGNEFEDRGKKLVMTASHFAFVEFTDVKCEHQWCAF